MGLRAWHAKTISLNIKTFLVGLCTLRKCQLRAKSSNESTAPLQKCDRRIGPIIAEEIFRCFACARILATICTETLAKASIVCCIP